MKYLIKHQVLQEVSNDHLRRLQHLCEPSVERAQVLSLSHDTDTVLKIMLLHPGNREFPR